MFEQQEKMLVDAKFYQLSRGYNHLTLIKCYQRDKHQKFEVVLSFKERIIVKTN